MNIFATLFAIILYCVLTSFQVRALSNHTPFSKQHLLLGGCLSALLHAYGLYTAFQIPSNPHFALSHVFSLICWLEVLIVLFTSLWKPLENLSLFAFPLAALSLVIVLLAPSKPSLSLPHQASQIGHILVSLTCLSVLSLAGFQALLLHLQNRWLKNKHRDIAPRFPQTLAQSLLTYLPPLQTMEALLFQMVTLGFVLLSLTLLTAWLFLSPPLDLQIWPEISFQTDQVSKLGFSLLAWLLFALLLLGHYRSGWRGQTAVRLTLSGIGLLVAAYFGSKLFLYGG